MRYRSSRGFGPNPIVIIILINFMLLIATMIAPQIIYVLGLIPARFGSQPWTIITNMFVHAGLWHFFGNMITLFFFGTFLARLVGQGRFLTVYFGGGILGNILYLLLAPSLSVAVGASGAVYAIAGVVVMLKPNLRVLLYFIVPMPLWVVILVFFVIWSFIPGVAWQAHLGGLIFGLVAGYLFRKQLRNYF